MTVLVDAQSYGPLHQLDRIVRIEFAHDSITVIFDGPAAPGEHQSYLLVGFSREDRTQNLLFTPGEGLRDSDIVCKCCFQMPVRLRFVRAGAPAKSRPRSSARRFWVRPSPVRKRTLRLVCDFRLFCHFLAYFGTKPQYAAFNYYYRSRQNELKYFFMQKNQNWADKLPNSKSADQVGCDRV
jgi:hypothetical protein